MPRYRTTNRKGRYKRNRNSHFAVSVFFVFVVFGLAWLTWSTAAKYTKQQETEALMKVDAFYFTSDYLTEDGADYELNVGETEFEFELRNFDGLKISEIDIDYTVTVNGVTYTEGVLLADGTQSTKIKIEDLVPGEEYVISASGEHGYIQVLSAVVKVAEESALVYKHTEHFDHYVTLTVWTDHVSAEVLVEIPDGLIPDATDEVLEDLNGGDTYTLELDPYESAVYRFFTTKDYLDGDIPVIYSGNRLDETELE